MNPLSALCAAAATLSLVLAVESFRRHPRSPVNRGVALSALAYAVWVLFSGFAYAEPPGPVSPTLRVALAAYIVIQPIALATLMVFTKFSGVQRWVTLGPSFVLSALEVYQALTGVWLLQGTRGTPWGSAGVLADDPFWLNVDLVKGAWGSAIGFWVILRGILRAPGRRVREVLFTILGVSVVGQVLGFFLTAVVWQTWGYPDPTVLIGLLAVFAYFFLMVRYRHLERLEPAGDHVLPALEGLVLLGSPEGTLVKLSPRLRELAGPFWTEGKSLAPAARDWPGADQAWARVVTLGLKVENLEGTLGGARFTVTLSPVFEPLGDVVGVLASFTPSSPFSEATVRYRLSPREVEVAAALAGGKSTDEIAGSLFISVATVKNHLHSLFTKTGTRNRVELVQALSASPFLP